MASVLGIDLYEKDIATVTAYLINEITGNANQDNKCISATGAHGLIEAHKKPAFKEVLKNFYINLPDGMPCVWVGRLKGAKQMKRCYGPDFFKEMMTESAGLSINHFFCGGKEGVAEELKEVSERTFVNSRVVGVYSPPFREMSNEEMQELAQQITSSGTHIVWIGLGTPKQEYIC